MVVGTSLLNNELSEKLSEKHTFIHFDDKTTAFPKRRAKSLEARSTDKTAILMGPGYDEFVQTTPRPLGSNNGYASEDDETFFHRRDCKVYPEPIDSPLMNNDQVQAAAAPAAAAPVPLVLPATVQQQMLQFYQAYLYSVQAAQALSHQLGHRQPHNQRPQGQRGGPHTCRRAGAKLTEESFRRDLTRESSRKRSKALSDAEWAEVNTALETKAFLKMDRAGFLRFIEDKVGSVAVQLYFVRQKSSPEVDRTDSDRVFVALCENVFRDMVTSRTMTYPQSYTLTTFIRCGFCRSFVFEKLTPRQLRSLAEDERGCRLVVAAVESYAQHGGAQAGPGAAGFADELERCCRGLAAHPYGKFVVETALEQASDPELQHRIVCALFERDVEWAFQYNPCLIEKALGYTEGEAFSALVERLRQVDPMYFLTLTLKHERGWTVWAVMKATPSCQDLYEGCRTADVLAKLNTVKKANQWANRVLRTIK